MLKAKEPGIGALTSRGQSGSHVVHAWLLHLNPLGGKIFDDQWRPVFQQEAGIKAAELLKQISDTGPAGIPGYGFGEMSNAFLQGQAAMYLDTIAIFGQVEDPAKSKIAGKVAYALHPKGTRASSETGGFGMAIPRNAANSEAAFLFIEWMTNKVNDKKVTGLGGNATRMSTWPTPRWSSAIRSSRCCASSSSTRTRTGAPSSRNGARSMSRCSGSACRRC